MAQTLKAVLVFFALVLCLLLGALLLGACSGILLHHAMDQGQMLSAEQVEAYGKLGSSVYGCFAIAGPPPAGSTVWVIVPKGTPVTFSFADNCHVVSK